MPHSPDRRALLRAARKKAGLKLLSVYVPVTLMDKVREAIDAIIKKGNEK